MKGSGAPGNRSRAAPRSPPCWIGAASDDAASNKIASMSGSMAAALTLLALLFELMIGYPDRLMAIIGHPVTWMGALIGALDRALNRDTATAAARRMAGTVTVLILIAAVGSIAFMVERSLLWLPFGWVVAALPASALLAQRSLHQHVGRVASALDTAGIAA